MEYLGNNDELMHILLTQEYMPNAVISSINIFLKDYALCIEVNFKINNLNEKEMTVLFQGVEEYGLNYSSSSFFYNVEMFKLLKFDELYYISFDPYIDDLSNRSTMDNDLILFENFEAYLHV